MRRKILVMGIAILLILTNAITVFANTNNVVAVEKDNKTELKAGDTFTIDLKATSESGINSIVGFSYSFNAEQLELVTETPGTNITPMEEDDIVTLVYMGNEIKNDATIYTITFSVKEGVEAGTDVVVNVGALTLIDVDLNEYTLPAQNVTITIAENETTPPADDGNGDENGGDGTQNPPADEGNGDENEGNGTQNPPADEDNKNENTVPGTTVIVGDDKKDDTTANKEIPKAGVNTILVAGIVAIIGMALIMYKKNEKYKDIK